jgi:spore maturation protein CgeB
MRRPLSLAFFGSSLVSAYWNGAATYYRGIIRALAERGHSVTFYEPDAFDRQQHRDIADPDWAKIVVYDPQDRSAVEQALDEARRCDVAVKASGVGVLDEELEAEVAALARPGLTTIFWDVDAPATLQRIGENAGDPFRSLIPHYDLILTYGGGDPVVRAYRSFGARRCSPI